MSESLFMLQGRIPVPVKSHYLWLNWFNSADRTVALTRFGDIIITTQFIGRGKPTEDMPLPLLFETMVATEDFSDYCWRRYGSWSCAQTGHDEMVRMLAHTLDDNALMPRARELCSKRMDFAFPKFGTPTSRAKSRTHSGVKMN